MPIEVKLAPISMIIAPRSLSSLIIVDIPVFVYLPGSYAPPMWENI